MLIVEIKSKRKREFSSIVVYVDPDRRILLLKRPNKEHIPYGGKWGFVGGGAEKGEEPRDVAVRETFEETGLKVLPQNLIDIGMVESPDGRDVYVFCCSDFEGTVDIQKVKHEHDDFNWVRADEIDDYDLPDNSPDLIKKTLSTI